MNQTLCLNNIGPQVCLYEMCDSQKNTAIYCRRHRLQSCYQKLILGRKPLLLMRLSNLRALRRTLRSPIVMESIVFTKAGCQPLHLTTPFASTLSQIAQILFHLVVDPQELRGALH